MSLPIELIDQVLSYLSPRHLINTALVCHSWARLVRRQLNQNVYIHTNRQYTQWLETLESATTCYGQLVRGIVIHPQVHLDLDDLPFLRLCPWVESFDIGAKDIKRRNGGYINSNNNINDIIGRKHQYPPLLQHWEYLKQLDGFHSDPATTWIDSHLTRLVCSFEDLSILLLGDTASLSDLVDLHLTFGCLDMPVATLEKIHTVCPALENLKLNVQSIYGTTTRMDGMTMTGEEFGGGPVSPCFTLKSLTLDDMMYFDPGCYSYLLLKYPFLSTLHLGFVFDEFYISPGGDDLCAYLQKNQSDLFDLISGYTHLSRLEIHLQGANEYVTSLWPSEQMTKWMQQGKDRIMRTCGLQHLEMTYQRQSTHDILGLDGIINSWVGKHQLQSLLLDVYNNNNNNNNRNDTSIQSTLDSFLYNSNYLSGTPLLRNMTTLCVKCFPGFDISLTCLLGDLPSLKILDMAFGNFIGTNDRIQQQSSHGLEQFLLASSTISDTVHFMDLIQYHCQQLKSLCFENVTAMGSKTCIWDFSHHGLQHIWIKYLSFGGRRVDWLKIHESTANRSTWYHSSMAQGTHGSSKPFYHHGAHSLENGDDISLELKCYFVEDILFC